MDTKPCRLLTLSARVIARSALQEWQGRVRHLEVQISIWKNVSIVYDASYTKFNLRAMLYMHVTSTRSGFICNIEV